MTAIRCDAMRESLLLKGQPAVSDEWTGGRKLRRHSRLRVSLQESDWRTKHGAKSVQIYAVSQRRSSSSNA